MLTRSRQGWVGCDGGEEIQSTQQVTERFESQRTGERRRGEGIERRSKRGGGGAARRLHNLVFCFIIYCVCNPCAQWGRKPWVQVIRVLI